MEEYNKCLEQLNEVKYKNLKLKEEISRLKELKNTIENKIEVKYKEIKEKKIDDKKDVSIPLLIQQLDDSKIIIEKLKEEIKFYKNEVDILKKDNKVKRNDELEIKNNFLNNKIKLLEKNIEELKSKNINEQKEYEKKIDELEFECGQTKSLLAQCEYEKLLMEKKYAMYIQKLKDKLSSMGIIFKTIKNK